MVKSSPQYMRISLQKPCVYGVSLWSFQQPVGHVQLVIKGTVRKKTKHFQFSFCLKRFFRMPPNKINQETSNITPIV